MPFRNVLNKLQGLSQTDRRELEREFSLLYAEIGVLRANFNALAAKLDADATVTDTNYAATCGVAATTGVSAVAAAARQFTPT
jgi:hypothetical protein